MLEGRYRNHYIQRLNKTIYMYTFSKCPMNVELFWFMFLILLNTLLHNSLPNLHYSGYV